MERAGRPRRARRSNHDDRCRRAHRGAQVGCPAPSGTSRSTSRRTAGTCCIAPGRIYVDGLLCENDDRQGSCTRISLTCPARALPDDDGNYAVYLDVWERHITAVDQYGRCLPAARRVGAAGTRHRDAHARRLAGQAAHRSRTQELRRVHRSLRAPTGQLRAQRAPGDRSVERLPRAAGWRLSAAGEPAVPGRGARRRRRPSRCVQVVARQRRRSLEGDVDRCRRADDRGRGRRPRRCARLRGGDVGRARRTKSACCAARRDRCSRS